MKLRITNFGRKINDRITGKHAEGNLFNLKKKERKNKKISKCFLTKLCFCNTFRDKTAAPTSISLAEKQSLKVH